MEPRPRAPQSESLVDRVMAGDPRAAARAISVVEAGGPAAADLVSRLHAHTGRASLVGLTGPPGAGKSTLVGHLVTAYRRTGARVAVLAVDPSSPFSGGAILGDRIRMQAHAEDPLVFIRSMATRGQLGGLAAAAADAIDVLDAAGFDIILIETVGVGQDEVDISRTADVCVLVLVPGAGDDVQAMKAGVMEIADVFVVNKADQPGADRAVTAIEQMLATDQRRTSAPPPVVRAVATTGQGIEDLVRVIDERRLAASDEGRRRDRSDRRLRDVLVRRALDRLRHDVLRDGEWEALVARVDSRRQDPYAAADALLRRLGTAGLIDHIGVATDAAEASVAFFGDLLGRSAGPAEDVRSQGVRVRFVETGDTRIEIIEAIDPDAPFAKSLRSRGPGLHHVALRVDDLEAALTRLAEAGVRLIDRRGRPGAHGTRVAFVHPSSTRGVLVELVQHGGDDRAHR